MGAPAHVSSSLLLFDLVGSLKGNCWRPYHAGCTGSLLTSEVKRHRARLVLGWGTAWEDLRVLSAFRIRHRALLAPVWPKLASQITPSPQPAQIYRTQTRESTEIVEDCHATPAIQLCGRASLEKPCHKGYDRRTREAPRRPSGAARAQRDGGRAWYRHLSQLTAIPRRVRRIPPDLQS